CQGAVTRGVSAGAGVDRPSHCRLHDKSHARFPAAALLFPELVRQGFPLAQSAGRPAGVRRCEDCLPAPKKRSIPDSRPPMAKRRKSEYLLLKQGPVRRNTAVAPLGGTHEVPYKLYSAR